MSDFIKLFLTGFFLMILIAGLFDIGVVRDHPVTTASDVFWIGILFGGMIFGIWRWL